jgi:hypothetical protein
VALQAVVRANAERFAADLAPVVADIRAAGHCSQRSIAAELSARGMLTRRSGWWSVENVGNLVGWVQGESAPLGPSHDVNEMPSYAHCDKFRIKQKANARFG